MYYTYCDDLIGTCLHCMALQCGLAVLLLCSAEQPLSLQLIQRLNFYPPLKSWICPCEAYIVDFWLWLWSKHRYCSEIRY
jgi:hypothetical protein